MADGRNYQRKGDAFSEQVRRGEGPPCVIYWQRPSTGRTYYTRVPVHRCYALRASDAAAAVRGVMQADPESTLSAAQLAQLLALSWQPEAGAVGLVSLDTAPAYQAGRGPVCRVLIAVTQTGKAAARGTRFWLICPRCSRQCGAVYGSPWNNRGVSLPNWAVTGCRACLGLTDQSRQEHKTLKWATAVMGERAYSADPSGHYRVRSWRAVSKAADVYKASFARAFRGLGWPLPGDEKAPSR